MGFAGASGAAVIPAPLREGEEEVKVSTHLPQVAERGTSGLPPTRKGTWARPQRPDGPPLSCSPPIRVAPSLHRDPPSGWSQLPRQLHWKPEDGAPAVQTRKPVLGTARLE